MNILYFIWDRLYQTQLINNILPIYEYTLNCPHVLLYITKG